MAAAADRTSLGPIPALGVVDNDVTSLMFDEIDAMVFVKSPKASLSGPLLGSLESIEVEFSGYQVGLYCHCVHPHALLSTVRDLLMEHVSSVIAFQFDTGEWCVRVIHVSYFVSNALGIVCQISNVVGSMFVSVGRLMFQLVRHPGIQR